MDPEPLPRCAICGWKARVGFGRPHEKQPRRVLLRQAGNAPDDLTGNAKRLAAGREDGQARTGAQQRHREARGGGGEMLAIVQYEK